MASPDVDPGILKTLLDWGWAAVLGLVGIIWKTTNTQLENRRTGEIAIHKRIGEHEQKDNDRFEKLMSKMAENHAEILTEIGNMKGRIK